MRWFNSKPRTVYALMVDTVWRFNELGLLINITNATSFFTWLSLQLGLLLYTSPQPTSQIKHV